MDYDFIFLQGVEFHEGDKYVSTPLTKIIDKDVRLIFAKTYNSPDNLLVLPEIKVDVMNIENVYKAIFHYFSHDKNHNFYVVKSDSALEVIKLDVIGSILKIHPLNLGIVNPEILFAKQSGLVEKINEFKKNI